MSSPTSLPHRPWWLRNAVAAIVALAVVCGMAAPAGAQEAAAPEAAGEAAAPGVDLPREQLQSLLETLQDDAKRQELVQTLEALVAVEAPPPEAAPDLIGGLNTVGSQALEGVSEWMGQMGVVAERVSGAVLELYDFVLGVQEQVMDPEARIAILQTAFELLVTLGAAIGGLILARLAVLRPYRSLSSKEPRALAGRVPHLIGRLALDLACVAAIALAGYGALFIVKGEEPVRVITLAVLNALLVTGVVHAVARFVLAPGAPGLRLLPMPDMAAHYLYIWVRRITVPLVYGYFLLQMAVVLGIAPATYRALLSLLGLLIALLVVILILQNRTVVADWISGAAKIRRARDKAHEAVRESRERREEERRAAEREAAEAAEEEAEGDLIPVQIHLPELRFLALRRAIAPVWHVLAILYTIVFYVVWMIRGEAGFGYLATATLWTAVIFGGALLIVSVSERLLLRAFAISPEIKEKYPDLEARTNRYLPILTFVIKAVVIAAALLGILQAWDLGGYVWFTTGAGRALIGSLLSIFITIALAVMVWEGLNHFIERRVAERVDEEGNAVVASGRSRTILGLLRNTVRIVLLLMLGIIVLSELGVDITPLLAGAGVIGLAVGFGAQTLVKDIITGLFILFEDTVSVGDVATVGGHTGLVEAMSIRTVRLRDLAGTVHVVPYSEVTTVQNLTKDFSFALLDIGVAYREDVDQVMQVLHEVTEELRRHPDYRRDILEPLEMFGVDRFADSAVVIRCRIKTRPIRQWFVMRGFNRLMKKRFDELGIEIPFPHQTLYFGVGKDGKAPPAHVEMIRPERLEGGELESEAPEETQADAGRTAETRA